MAVSNISSIPTAQSANLFEPVGNDTLDRNDFMTLFITQLQYQDPLEPMDSYEMASQLAQFSNMEATMKMSDNMERLLEYQTSQNNLQLLTLIGKDVQAFGNEVAVVDGMASATEFTLTDAADTCVVEIYDAAGHLVKTINMGYQPAGPIELAWDGTTEQIKPPPEGEQGEEEGEAEIQYAQAADGAYSYLVGALNANGQQIEVEYRTSGRVTGLEFDSGQAILTVDDHISLSVSDILTVE